MFSGGIMTTSPGLYLDKGKLICRHAKIQYIFQIGYVSLYTKTSLAKHVYNRMLLRVRKNRNVYFWNNKNMPNFELF